MEENLKHKLVKTRVHEKMNGAKNDSGTREGL